MSKQHICSISEDILSYWIYTNWIDNHFFSFVQLVCILEVDRQEIKFTCIDNTIHFMLLNSHSVVLQKLGLDINC